jgi:antitoxin (DNA-binding transcriptional repressor) of toxin-antitoxin stability system
VPGEIWQSEVVQRLSATEAARGFSALLDQVEHDGETFLVERRGRVIARVAPAAAATGRSLKALLRARTIDERWPADLAQLRAGREPEDRRSGT